MKFGIVGPYTRTLILPPSLKESGAILLCGSFGPRLQRPFPEAPSALKPASCVGAKTNPLYLIDWPSGASTTPNHDQDNGPSQA
jgi:hypothetical protein